MIEMESRVRVGVVLHGTDEANPLGMRCRRLEVEILQIDAVGEAITHRDRWIYAVHLYNVFRSEDRHHIYPPRHIALEAPDDTAIATDQESIDPPLNNLQS